MKKAAYLIPISFMVGAVAGFFGAKLYFEKKNQERIQKELDQINILAKKNLNKPPMEELVKSLKKEEEEPPVSKESIRTAVETLNKLNKTDYGKTFSPDNRPEKKESPLYKEDPRPPVETKYYISEFDLGEEDDFEIIHLTYYQDGVIADENDVQMSFMEIEEVLPPDILQKFGSARPNQPDGLYVRNLETKCDYEILLDLKTYEQVVGEKPYLKDM